MATLAAIPLTLILLTGSIFVSAGPVNQLLEASQPSTGSCPWVAASRDHTKSPAALAVEVVKKMTLLEKVSFVVLREDPPYENINSGIPSLCIPPLTLTDGPNGIAGGATGVTQLPASIGLAASFNPAITNSTGRVEGAEARTKGLDVVQGPELNLARVPQSGRTYEAYGEDPLLAAVMGTANVEGIQSQGVMAQAKHFTAYNQETDRTRVNEVVSQRALEELYDAPFASVIEQGHVVSVMCSYGSLDGTNTCSDSSLFDQLRAWGFDGFVRSDLSAITDPAAAFQAGLDLIKPAGIPAVVQLVRRGTIPIADLDAAVTSTLQEMFAFGLVAAPRPLRVRAKAASSAHSAVATRAAESSMVLLKNHNGLLPLSDASGSVAVIGSDAGTQATTIGRGSAQVRASTISTPIDALQSTLGPGVKVTYTPADSPRLSLPPIPRSDIMSTSVLPSQAPGRAAPAPKGTEPGTGDLHLGYTAPAAATASTPGTGPGWSSWSAVLRVPRSGVYEFSIEQNGDTWLDLDGRALVAHAGIQSRSLWSTTATLSAGRRYHLTVTWLLVKGKPAPQLGFADVSPEIAAAVAAARHASVAIVFAGAPQAEGVDRPSLLLPGDANALISAVAAANPRTVVVLNTGGAVLMPWINDVAAVLEAWYPGQEDGIATAAVLEGQVDPSGHLPLTFPAMSDPSPVGTAAQFPGVDGTVDYTEGLDIGYRWYQANNVAPLFPFGYGLSYTSFTLSHPALDRQRHEVDAKVTVTNTGSRAGTAVVQAYLHYPQAAAEPPQQLRSFAAVSLKPGQASVVHLTLPSSAFQAYLNGGFRTVPGTYSIDIGQSSANLPIRLTTKAPEA